MEKKVQRRFIPVVAYAGGAHRGTVRSIQDKSSLKSRLQLGMPTRESDASARKRERCVSARAATFKETRGGVALGGQVQRRGRSSSSRTLPLYIAGARGNGDAVDATSRPRLLLWRGQLGHHRVARGAVMGSWRRQQLSARDGASRRHGSRSHRAPWRCRRGGCGMAPWHRRGRGRHGWQCCERTRGCRAVQAVCV